MPKTPLDTGRLYTIIADTMPTEGRDFTIDILQTGDNPPQVVIKPLTAVGRGFVPVLLERLSEQMKDKGATFSADGAVEREAETVNTIREAIKREAMASLQARLKEVQRQHQATLDTMKKEDAARDKNAVTAEDAKRRSDTLQNLQRLSSQKRQMEFMVAHMDEARKRADEASLAAAKAAAKAGMDWATDLDAPLTSLFDRQDVANKLNQYERYIQQLAAHMFMVEDLTNSAAAVGRQYIMQK